ncbi:galectin-12 isoform X1 [Bombina bombina]|uniref:galectin-12 isoform X1 n=1 Tax=Bombina bombina TaxID=8345 RepID=UPI00235AB038|nr:galectin-12 isoform X1 [Bombina bombina]
MILIQGYVAFNASRFQVDFQCGCSTSPRADVAFHFNPRFSDSETHVICNTLHMGQWLEEKCYSRVPFHRSESFLLLFLFQDEEVKVSIGGQHILEFNYRVPLCGVDTLGIYGDVTVKDIVFLCCNPYNIEMTEYPACEPLKLGSTALATPFSRSLPEGLSIGHMITVRGLAKVDPDDIHLLLKSGDFIPFKLTVNFRDQSVCYNHLMGASWGHTQAIQPPFFPFHAERFFEILILSEDGLFKLAINGYPMGEFTPPGLDCKAIKEIQIIGSVELYTIRC